MQPTPDVVISHQSYSEPAFITYARERGFAREHQAHDRLAAAKAAATRPFVLRDLPGMLANVNHSDLDVIYGEVERLRKTEDTYLNLLATAAWHEAGSVNPEVLRPVRQLAQNTYVAWSGVADAPAGWTMTWLDARAAGFPEERLLAAGPMTADTNAFNRAGPGEACLTVAAIIEAYASDVAYEQFRLTPGEVQPLTTSDVSQNPDTGEWEEGETRWTPWPPGAVPTALPSTMKDKF